MRTRRTLAALAAVVALTATACGGSSSGGSQSSKISGTITVFAAASLTGAFTELGHDFEQSHPGTHVRFSFGGSDTLAAQITNDAPADVFASASPTTMQLVTDKKLAASASPPIFARNQLQIAVPPSNPKKLKSLADIVRPGIKLAMCAPTVPCGSAALTAFKAANLTPHPVTQEVDVKSVLTKVELGEVDAGLVYKTDVQSAGGKVIGVSFPEAGGAINSYPIARLVNAPNPNAAQAFIDLVLSDTGQSVLAKAGFLPPSP
jgi:molybdate transport system substrate-binding protein